MFWRRVAEAKIYYGNAALYLGVVNFALLLATFKKSYDLNLSAFLLVPVGLLGVFFIGWMDYHFILKEQNLFANRKNDLKEQLDRIEAKI
jgi:UDP-N-acetylmuramyl pentapeptide phosphotransferase/UDP-N-acetylglucosamine-1-phosphate transferase